MVVQYMHLSYEEYKNLEGQMKEFKETTHMTEGGFYHKSVRLKVGEDFIIEYHGPLVGGYGHRTNDELADGGEPGLLQANPGCCQEQADGPWQTYVPCNEPAKQVVYQPKDRRVYLMCDQHAWHNIENRGATYIGHITNES